MMTDPLPLRAERYDTLRALRSDKRFTNDHSTTKVRDYIEAKYWLSWNNPDTEGPTTWGAVKEELGWSDDLRTEWSRIVRADLPRWEPGPDTGCEHALTSGPRKGGTCGKPALTTVRVTDPETGQWRRSGWCSKHHEEGRVLSWREAHRQGRDADPTPHPNCGGLLPCYLDLRAGSWEDEYREAAPYTWEPPTVGVCADDWPVLGRVHTVARRPKLTLILGDAS